MYRCKGAPPPLRGGGSVQLLKVQRMVSTSSPPLWNIHLWNPMSIGIQVEIEKVSVNLFSPTWNGKYFNSYWNVAQAYDVLIHTLFLFFFFTQNIFKTKNLSKIHVHICDFPTNRPIVSFQKCILIFGRDWWKSHIFRETNEEGEGGRYILG